MHSHPMDLVADTKFQVEFHSDLVHRFSFQSNSTPGQYMRRRERLDIWKKENKIGRGSYGSVWLHRCLTSEGQSELQAVKMISKRQISAARIDFYKELEAIAKFSQKKYHGLFVEYLGWYENDDSVFIAMEYLQHGDLGSHLTTPLPEDEAREITFQIAEGLEHLHENHFVHRDLKPGNVFVVRTGPRWWVKIGDFGFSKRIKEDSGLRSIVGTRLFVAPEVQMIYLPGADETSETFFYSEKIDIWSLGVMAFYMLFHEYPFTSDADHDLLKYARGASFPFPASSQVQSLSKECYEFLIAAMAPDAAVRISARGVLESSWLKQRPLEVISDMAALQLATQRLSDAPSQLNQTDPRKLSDSQKTITPRNFKELSPAMTQLDKQKKSTAYSTTRNYQIESPELALELSNGCQTKLQRGSKSTYEEGRLSFDAGQYKQAEIKLKQAYDELAKSLGPDHQDTFKCLLDLGKALHFGKKYAEAEAMFRQAFEGRDQLFGSAHKDTLKSLHWLGETLICREKYAEAENTFQKVLQGREQAFGSTHPRTLNSLHWLGLSRIRQEKHNQAEIVFRQAFKGREQVLGPNDEDALHSLHWLGVALFRQGNFVEAEAVFRQAFKGREAVFGPMDERTLNSLHWLGLAYIRQDKYARAELAFRRASEGREKALNSTHEETLNSLQFLGVALFRQEKYAEAKLVFQKTFEGRRETLGELHVATLASLRLLKQATKKDRSS